MNVNLNLSAVFTSIIFSALLNHLFSKSRCKSSHITIFFLGLASHLSAYNLEKCPAIAWGITNEKTAVEKYIALGAHVDETGKFKSQGITVFLKVWSFLCKIRLLAHLS